MLNGGKLVTNSKRPAKVDSSEEFLRQELEEGRASYMGDFNIRSPHIQKKQMEFGSST